MTRSALYVSAHRPEHLAKADRSRADALVVELEDGVPLSAKEDARRAAAAFLAEPHEHRVEVRVNGFGTGLLLGDLLAIAGGAPDAVRVPKVETPDDVVVVARLLGELGLDAQVLPILESARGLAAAREIALVPGVGGLLMGEEDLGADVGGGRAALTHARAALVLAARAAGLPAPLQSVWTDLGDHDGLRADCELGRGLGFVGRSVIHPAQIDVVHEIYTPSDHELDAARALVTTAGRGGSVLEDGRFVDDASVARARRLLDDAASR